MRTVIAAAALALGVGATSADAQVLGYRGYNPYTGRYYQNYAARSPLTGGVFGRTSTYNPYTGRGFTYGTAYNPWTGGFYRNRAYRNQWTGRYGAAGYGYNPWAGRYGYRYFR